MVILRVRVAQFPNVVQELVVWKIGKQLILEE
jgi:hypothetical protein